MKRWQPLENSTSVSRMLSVLSPAQRLLEQRSTGHVTLRMAQQGVVVLREAGAAKLRLPRGSHDAILINTSGGLAGGDTANFDITAEADCHLAITSQAAERVYRTLGPPASVTTHLTVEAGASLFWMPQETILFEGAALQRNFTVNLAATAEFVGVEMLVLGRTERGEKLTQFHLDDCWRIARDGQLLHADNLKLAGPVPTSAATLFGNTAFATIICVSTRAESLVQPLREIIGPLGGASAWNGKLIARLVARDGFELKKRLIPALSLLAGSRGVPKVWTM